MKEIKKRDGKYIVDQKLEAFYEAYKSKYRLNLKDDNNSYNNSDHSPDQSYESQIKVKKES